MDHIEELIDGFYYYDDMDDLVGPFKTFEQADIAYKAAQKWFHKETIRKMRDNMGA